MSGEIPTAEVLKERLLDQASRAKDTIVGFKTGKEFQLGLAQYFTRREQLLDTVIRPSFRAVHSWGADNKERDPFNVEGVILKNGTYKLHSPGIEGYDVTYVVNSMVVFTTDGIFSIPVDTEYSTATDPKKGILGHFVGDWDGRTEIPVEDYPKYVELALRKIDEAFDRLKNK